MKLEPPSWYKLQNLDYSYFQTLDRLARSTQLDWGRSTKVYPIAVSNDLDDVHQSIFLYHSAWRRLHKEPLLGVTRSYGVDSDISRGYHMWVTPNFADNCDRLLITVAHEIAHAYVGSYHQHDSTWERLYTEMLRKMYMIWKAPVMAKELVQTLDGVHRG